MRTADATERLKKSVSTTELRRKLKRHVYPIQWPTLCWGIRNLSPSAGRKAHRKVLANQVAPMARGKAMTNQMCRCPEKPGKYPGTQKAVNHTLRGPQMVQVVGGETKAGAEALQEIGGLRPQEP